MSVRKNGTLSDKLMAAINETHLTKNDSLCVFNKLSRNGVKEYLQKAIPEGVTFEPQSLGG